ncbi:hypothetical protein PFISCL1PPCAC_22703, partial [Pristionchus fissidentatus]
MVSRSRLALCTALCILTVSVMVLIALGAIMMTSDDVDDEPSATPIPMGAVVYDKRFQEVVEVFRSNLDADLERAGAAFAVYYKGKPAVHVWGGWSLIKDQRLPDVNDPAGAVKVLSGVPWEAHTRSVMFSTTKCLSALVLAYSLQN